MTLSKKIITLILASLLSISTFTLAGCSKSTNNKNNGGNNISASSSNYDKDGFNKYGYNKDGYKRCELDDNGNPLFPKWGLGQKQTESVSNDRNYDWYIDQTNTGKYSTTNCGPTAAIMAIKWVNKDFSKNVAETRAEFNKRYGTTSGWDDIDLERCLRENGIRCSAEFETSEKGLKEYIKKGYIAIVNVDMQYFTKQNDPEKRVGRIVGSGQAYHYMLIKGYKVVDNKLYFEAYDPDSNGLKYIDGSYKGKDRYYLGSELVTAINKYKSSFILIDGSTSDNLINNTAKGQEVKLSPYLEKQARLRLGKPEGTLYEGDLKRVFDLSILSTSFIQMEKELKYFPNLNSLYICDCQVTDLSFLQNHKYLTELSLAMNNIKDISPLKDLKALRKLMLSNNKIEDISPLKNLANLQELSLSGNPIKDYSPLKTIYGNLKMKDFNITN